MLPTGAPSHDAVLLVAEDEGFVRSVLRELAPEGFETTVAATVDEALARLAETRPDVALVDACLPGGGRDACARLRAASSAPIIVAPSAGGADELVDYLDLGADDYLSRPERLRELVARIRALLRRRPMGQPAVSAGVLQVGDVCLDAERHEVVVRGQPRRLQLKQFQLLELLLTNAGQVLPRATILRRVWGIDSPAGSNTLEVQVKRLRRHIEEDPAAPTRIRTVRGIGYLYADDRTRL